MKKKRLQQRILGLVLTTALIATLTGCGGDKQAKEAEDAKNYVYQEQMLVGKDSVAGDIGTVCASEDAIYISSTEWEEGEAEVATEDAGTAEAEDTAAEGSEDENAADAEAAAEDSEAAPEDTEANTDATAEAAETDAEIAAENAEAEAVAETGATVDNTTVAIEDGSEEEEYAESISITHLYKCNLDGSDVQEIPMEAVSSNEYLNYLAADAAGNIYMLYSGYDEATEKSTYILHVADSTGKETNQIDLSTIFEGEDTYIAMLLVAADGNIYLQGDQYIYGLNAAGEKQFALKVDGDWIMGTALTKEGEPIVQTNGEDGTKVTKIDVAKKAMGESVTLDGFGSGNNYLLSGSEYSFYYGDSSGLNGYDLDKSASTKVIDWIASDINTTYMSSPIALADGTFLYSYYDYSGDGAENGVYRLTKVDPKDVVTKTNITYGGLYVDETVRAQAVKFNKSQNEYRIVVKDYSSEEEPLTKMNADIAAGDIPDILDLSGISVDTYIAKGMLADLYTLMDQDKDIHKEDFIENVLKLMETDGKLYHIAPSFGVNTLVGKTSDIGNLEQFTIQDLIDLEASKPEGTKAFYLMSNTEVLSQMCYLNYGDYIDWTTGECHFDNEDFVKLLEYANTYPKEDAIDWENSESMPSQIQNGKVLFASIYSMSYEEIELYSKMYGEDISFVSYPSTNYTGPSVNMSMDLGIYAKSSNKEGAWAFLKTFLTKDYVCNNSYNYYSGFPLRKDALENQLTRFSATETYTDEYGNEIEPYQSSWGYDDFEAEIGPLSEEEVAKVREVIASVDHLTVYNEQISTIITEESGAYFSGQKSAKDVADIIQNRVSTYVNENR